MAVKTCLGEILERNGVCPQSTPYAQVIDYPIIMRDHFAVTPIREHRREFAVFDGYERELLSKTERLRERLAATESKLHCSRESDADELHSLRAEKKALASEIDCEACGFYDAKPEKYVVSYQNILVANTLANMTELVPPMRGVERKRLHRMPLFTRNVCSLRDARLSEAGVVGGPCLFGTDEMIVRVTHTDGGEYLFDFNTGEKCCGMNGCDLSEHFMEFGEQIADVSFDNYKTRMTLQEYESLAYPMEIAAALEASFLFPIPDMSYMKFLESITENLRPAVRREMLGKFAVETRKIADMHIELFERLAQKYKPKRCMLMHGRDEEALSFFYSEREKYFNGSKFLRRCAGFSSKPGKNEPVYDYISLLAAPFYFWGTKNIIQVDPIDETSSMEKCAKVHKNEFALTAIMYPEIISKNSAEVIFYARREDKEYMPDGVLE